MKNSESQTVTENLFYLLDSFRETALTKQRALIENNMESLGQCITAEEKLLYEVQTLFKKRAGNSQLSDSNLMKETTADDNAQKEFFSLLKKERDVITKKVKAINLINEQNKFLTEQSRGFIKSLVGELAGNNNNRILDRKA